MPIKTEQIKSMFLPGAGPFFLGGLALTGPFSRGLVNIFFALLAAWGLLWLFYGRKHLNLTIPRLPIPWLKGLIVFTLTYFLASIFSDVPLRALYQVMTLVYLLTALPLVWLAISVYPKIIGWLPLLYGVGLLITTILSLSQADFCIQCIRAKSTLGRIELGIILGQLPPVIIGALALSIDAKKKFSIIFFILVLIASYVAIRLNCSRITMITIPFFIAIMFWVHKRSFFNFIGLLLLLFTAVGIAASFKDAVIVERFQDMARPSSQSTNNETRFKYWQQGIDIFLKHPILGIGPDAIPNVVYLQADSPANDSANPPLAYAHAHNIYLTSLAETGILGFLGFLALHAIPLWLLITNRKTDNAQIKFWVWSAIIINLQFITNGMTDSIFGVKPMMYVYWTIITVALWLIYSAKTPVSRSLAN